MLSRARPTQWGECCARQMAHEGLVALFPGRIQLLDIERLLSVSTNL